MKLFTKIKKFPETVLTAQNPESCLKKEFNTIYSDSIQMHVSNTTILNELIKSLKSNIEELQLENDMINKSLTFYRELSRKSIQQMF